MSSNTIAQLLTEGGPALRFRAYSRWSQLLYTKSFASFGTGSTIVAPLRLRNVRSIHIGDRVVIFEGSWLQCEQDTQSRVEVGDDTYIGHHVHIHATGTVMIGRRAYITDNVTISDGVHEMGDLTMVRSRGDIHIGDGVFIGVGATILGGVTIGEHARIGAGAVVSRDVPPYGSAAGVPARTLH